MCWVDEVGDPGAGEFPVADHRPDGNVQEFGYLLVGQSCEEPEFNNAGRSRIGLPERTECVVKFFKRSGRRSFECERIVKRDSDALSTPFVGVTCPGMVDHDLAHRCCGDAEEMAPAVRGEMSACDVLQECVVDEFRGNHRLPGPGGVQVVRSDTAEFVVHQRHKRLQGIIAARSCLFKEYRQVHETGFERSENAERPSHSEDRILDELLQCHFSIGESVIQVKD